MPTPAGPLVAVVGGGLAGMAAAARLAKMGHRVRLHETSDRLGGRWATRSLADAPGPDPVLADDAPGVLGFPAPWRDLFRKSGRPLEAELARSGYALEPAAPPTYRFADGTELVLPSDRGDQQDALRRTFGPAPAARWQHLLDSLDDVWQALRPLGLEEAYVPEALTRDVVRRLRPRGRLADLADALDEPRLRALVRSTAHRQGTTPEQAPALAAVDLLVARTFGRWQVVPRPDAPARTTGRDAGDLGRTSLLVETLVARLALRGVEVRLDSEVVGLDGGRDGVTGVRTRDGAEPVDRVVLAVDPWTATALLPPTAARGLRRALRGATAARLPVAIHTVLDEAPDAVAQVQELVVLDGAGVPVLETRRRLAGHVVRTVHDHRTPTAQPGSGLVTAGFRGWRRRPGTATGLAGVALAGAASPAGPAPSAVVQTGALAAYAVAGRRD